jgi:hypothetical protein
VESAACRCGATTTTSKVVFDWKMTMFGAMHGGGGGGGGGLALKAELDPRSWMQQNLPHMHHDPPG